MGSRKLCSNLKCDLQKAPVLRALPQLLEITWEVLKNLRCGELARGSRPLGIDLWLCLAVLSFSPPPLVPFFSIFARTKDK